MSRCLILEAAPVKEGDYWLRSWQTGWDPVSCFFFTAPRSRVESSEQWGYKSRFCLTQSFDWPGPFFHQWLFISAKERLTWPNHLKRRSRTTAVSSTRPSFEFKSSSLSQGSWDGFLKLNLLRFEKKTGYACLCLGRLSGYPKNEGR